ncbi:MAG: glycosyltransferase [Nitrospirae bacterium]|nr:glycosyltransferase [Nitrospirota bacterium]
MTIAVIIPAYNEGQTIAVVLEQLHRSVPDAQLWVVDNNSADHTQALARDTIARLGCQGGVLSERRQGKSFALRKGFNEVNADVYVMVDADLTYPADALPKLLAPVLGGEADMVVGDRLSGGRYARENARRFHDFGNRLVRKKINVLFGSGLRDIMSGYRVLSRDFVKLCPILSNGFEVETEMTIHALDKRFRILEIPIDYRDRPEGSASKLNTFRDGLKVLKTVFFLFKNYRPMPFFLSFAALFLASGLLVGAPVLYEFATTGLILRIPSAILATGLTIFAVIFFSLALIMDTIVNFHRFDYELKRMQRGADD